MQLRRTTILLSVAGLILGQAGLASAKDLCLVDDQLFPSGYVLNKIKLPKKPGTSTSLGGYVVGSLGTRSTLSGVAVMRGGGQISVTIRTVPLDASSNAITASWDAVDSTLQSDAVRLDTDSDGIQDDGAISLSTLDCETVPLP